MFFLTLTVSNESAITSRRHARFTRLQGFWTCRAVRSAPSPVARPRGRRRGGARAARGRDRGQAQAARRTRLERQH